MVKCDKSIRQPRDSNVSIYSSYWGVKHIQVISLNKVCVLLVYTILINSGSHSNAQSCSLCNTNQTPHANDPQASYEEFIFEHQVTRQDAIDALQTLHQDFFDGPPSGACKSVTCTRNVMGYCYGPQFINDHCWCELGHANEGLPFIPHICYVGEKQHQAAAGSCFFYEEVKECCCAPALARQWKHISIGSTITAFPYTLVLTVTVLIAYKAHVLKICLH